VWAQVDQLTPRVEVAAAAEQVLEQVPLPDSDANEAWRGELAKRYAVDRLFLRSPVEVIASTVIAGSVGMVVHFLYRLGLSPMSLR